MTKSAAYTLVGLFFISVGGIILASLSHEEFRGAGKPYALLGAFSVYSILAGFFFLLVAVVLYPLGAKKKTPEEEPVEDDLTPDSQR